MSSTIPSKDQNEDTPKYPWVETIRRESGLIEHICKHGVGHPAIGSVQFMELNGVEMMGVHGCDGCCHDPEWQLADAREGLLIANKMLFALIKEKKAFKEEIKALKDEVSTLRKSIHNRL